MKVIFWIGIIGLLLFEIANVYFIMPMPGSQKMNSIDIAYFLYTWRWIFRCLSGIMIVAGLFKSKWKQKWSLIFPVGILSAITGKLKGYQLPGVFSTQTSLGEWLRLFPYSFVMQPDSSFITSYNTTTKYESGKSKSKLTGTDSLSWKDKSWVIGIKVNKEKKAYDWNRLKREHIIHDEINNIPVLIILAPDSKSFFAFERPYASSQFYLSNNTMISKCTIRYNGILHQLNCIFGLLKSNSNKYYYA